MDERIKAVQRMQDYIDEHLCESVTLADLAAASSYSPWYSHRLFAQLVGLTPADYIRRLRLSRSALALRDERRKIADVAFEVGFNSVDGYQRAFYREFGCNPGDYAAHPVPICLFRPYGVQYSASREEKKVEKVKTIFIQTIEKPARRVIIKRGVKAEEYWSYCEEVGCDVWGILSSIPSIGGEPVCLWLPEKYIKQGTSKYVQGVEVPLDYDGALPEGFEVIELPAAKYLMFRGEPFAEEDYEQAIGELRQALESYDPKAAGYEWDKDNPDIQLEPIGERGYIELYAVK